MEIRIDGGGGYNGGIVKKLAEQWQCRFGSKRVVVSQVNHGVVGSWKAAWRPKFGELFAVFEDDAEVSSQWYRWLVAMWLVYGKRDDLAAVSLQRQREVYRVDSLLD